MTYFDKPEIDLAGKRLIAVFTAYNEADRIPFFLSYYRRMGVDHFLAIDNNSTDNTRELLQGQRDVTYFHTTDSYVASKAGRLWTTELANHYCNGRWCLTLDLDEQLVFPGCEHARLSDLCDYLDEHGYEGIFTVFLDMYSGGPLSEAVYTPGQPYLEVCDWFEADTYSLRQPMYFPQIAVFGGPRQRIFWEQGKRGTGPSMRKLPLIKWRPGFKYFYSTHSSRPVRLADVTGALLHFKFFSHFSAFAQRELLRGDRVQTADYENYVRLTQERNVVFRTEGSVRYESSTTLVERGVAVCTRRYLNWLRPRLNQRIGGGPARKYDAEVREAMKQAWEQATLKLAQLPVLWSLLGGGSEGAVLGVHERSVLGWFLDRSGSEPIRSIEARIDDRVVARGDTGASVWGQAVIDADYRESLFCLTVPESVFKDRDQVRVSLGARDDRASFASVTLYRAPSTARSGEFDGACFLSPEGRVGGWAWAPRDPSRTISVSIHIDGQFWRRVFANSYREHLKEKGMGDGAHGFTVELPESLDPAVPHLVQLTIHGTNLPLRRSPLHVPAREAVPLPVSPAQAEELRGEEGQVLAVRRGMILGWALDRADPSRKLCIEVIAGGKVRNVIEAGAPLPMAPRPGDLRQGHGFAIAVRPPWLALLGRRQRNVELRVAGSGLVLSDNLSVGDPGMRIEDTPYQGYCDPSEGGIVQGWVWRRDRPEEKIDVALFIDGVFLARVNAGRYRDDVKEAGVGDGWYGYAVPLPQRYRGGGEHVVDVVIAENGIPLANSGMVASGLSIRKAPRQWLPPRRAAEATP